MLPTRGRQICGSSILQNRRPVNPAEPGYTVAVRRRLWLRREKAFQMIIKALGWMLCIRFSAFAFVFARSVSLRRSPGIRPGLCR